MFNKPALFPKSAEPAGVRPQRPAASSSVSPAAAATPAAEPLTTSREGVTNTTATQDRVASRAHTVAAEAAEAGGSRLIVGPDVKLKGAEILDCDTLVVEGRVEATMDSRVIRIAENGSYQGTVGIDVAEIHGRFEGELTARQQLVIHATGRVSGKIRYGTILIEEGGEISGDVQSLARAGQEGLRQVETRSPEARPLAAVAG